MQDDLIIHTLRWEILRHQYGIFVAESQTFLLAKRPQRRRAKEKRMLSQAMLAFKCMTGFAPIYLSSKFLTHGEVSGRATRNSQLLHIPLYKSKSGQRTFFSSYCKSLE